MLLISNLSWHPLYDILWITTNKKLVIFLPPQAALNDGKELRKYTGEIKWTRVSLWTNTGEFTCKHAIAVKAAESYILNQGGCSHCTELSDFEEKSVCQSARQSLRWNSINALCCDWLRPTQIPIPTTLFVWELIFPQILSTAKVITYRYSITHWRRWIHNYCISLLCHA